MAKTGNPNDNQMGKVTVGASDWGDKKTLFIMSLCLVDRKYIMWYPLVSLMDASDS